MEDNCGEDVRVQKNVEETQHENNDVNIVVNFPVEVKKDVVEIVVNPSVEESSIKIADTIIDDFDDAQATIEGVLMTTVENEDNVISTSQK
ncbi:hypothetical protein ZOSMA_5G00050 [Zostera marina]|uniref:Uncharacterized protein n=1 Tax=Zostera marina TaxID=29655 RepID=A0A0K9NW22_ZOSMR|nr:hypothetical protein ZOSMA_5G00050 [Zostera marina]